MTLWSSVRRCRMNSARSWPCTRAAAGGCRALSGYLGAPVALRHPDAAKAHYPSVDSAIPAAAVRHKGTAAENGAENRLHRGKNGGNPSGQQSEMVFDQ